MNAKIELKTVTLNVNDDFWHASVVQRVIDSTGYPVGLEKVEIDSLVNVAEPGLYPVMVYFTDPATGERVESKTMVKVLPLA